MDTTFPLAFTILGTPLPPMLLTITGVDCPSRYIGMYYQGTKATWSDFCRSATFSFYQVWDPLTSHLAIRIPLALVLKDYNPEEQDIYPGLGSDDSSPTHLLLLDRQDHQMALAPWRGGMVFLKAQHPPAPPRPEDEADIDRAVALAIADPTPPWSSSGRSW